VIKQNELDAIRYAVEEHQQSEQSRRRELFEKVALVLLANDLIKEKEFDDLMAETEAWANTILRASETFATNGTE